MIAIADIANIMNAEWLEGTATSGISHLLIDSRKLIVPEQALFFAIPGERHDGHHYIANLYQKGVRYFVIRDRSWIKDMPEAHFLVVNDVIDALQSLAIQHRLQFQYPVVGITGSNGKTIIKEWLYQLLQHQFSIVRSPKSYNSQIGVPLSVWQMAANHNLGFFEAGISQPGEMEKLQKIIQPTMGLFTNIGQAHAAGFSNLQEKVREKLKLFEQVGTLLYCSDHAPIQAAIEEWHSSHPSTKLLTWSFNNPTADLAVVQKEPTTAGMVVTATHQNKAITLFIPFKDDASIENAMHCWLCCLSLGIPHETVAEGMKALTPIAMRLELKEGVNNCSIINDSYNSDIASLRIALDFLSQQHQHPKKTLILSDILQSGMPEASLYEAVAQLIKSHHIDRLLGVGNGINQQHQLLQQAAQEVYFFEHTHELLQRFPAHQFQNETILIKGARAYEFEKISQALQRKAHQTILEVNLNHLEHNLNTFKGLLRPGVKLMVMVKAFSYGSGSFEIANLLQFSLVDYLAVAYADEGVELRQRGITLPILVMNPEAGSFDVMIQHRLEPEIYSLELLHSFSKAIREAGVLAFPVHLMMDTGMHRLGFAPEDLEDLTNALANNNLVHVQSVCSHLAASDAKEHDAFTLQQIQRYEAMSQLVKQVLGYPVLRHILNSAGIARFPEAQFDMVRLGIGLYGIDGAGSLQGQLHQVGSLKATISQIKFIKAGESIGYNRRGRALNDSKIATVSIGYADGYDRRFGNGVGKMLVNGQLAPTIGDVCMDMTMLDISGIQEAKEGDTVTVFGEGLPVGDLAQWIGTIPYEILTNVSQRVKRVYYQE